MGTTVLDDLDELLAENRGLKLEIERAGEREMAAWAERDQYMASNIRLVTEVRRLRAQLTDALEIVTMLGATQCASRIRRALSSGVEQTPRKEK